MSFADYANNIDPVLNAISRTAGSAAGGGTQPW
jgi:hypothetical protein